MTRMDRVATVQARIGWKSLTADEYVDDGFAFLSTPNIKSPTIDFRNVNFINEFRYEESPELKLRVGDVLLAKDGSTLGIANCVRHLERPATVNGSIAVLRPFAVEPRFLTYWLRAAPTQAKIAQVKDGMGVPHLFQRDIRVLPVPDIPQQEQGRIADFLDDQISRIDNIINARQEHTLLARSHASVARTELLSGAGHEWSAPRVAHIYRTGSGSTPPSDDPSFYDGGIPWVNTGDVNDGLIVDTKRQVSVSALESFSTLVRYPAGALVVAMYGQGSTKGRVGLLGVSACVNQACCVLQADAELAQWGFYWFRAYKQDVVALALGAGQPNLSQEIIRNIRLPIPPEKERPSALRKLALIDERLAGLTSASEVQVALLAEYKTSLTTAAVTGELDVTTARRGIPA